MRLNDLNKAQIKAKPGLVLKKRFLRFKEVVWHERDSRETQLELEGINVRCENQLFFNILF